MVVKMSWMNNRLKLDVRSLIQIRIQILRHNTFQEKNKVILLLPLLAPLTCTVPPPGQLQPHPQNRPMSQRWWFWDDTHLHVRSE